MKKTIPAALLVLCAASSTTALGSGPLSQGNSYFGGTFTQLTYDEDFVADDAEPTALIGRLGHFMADNIALEGRLGTGLNEDTVRVPDGTGGSVPVDVELDSLFGFYLVGHLPLGHAGSLYGLAGYTSAKAKASVDGYTFTESDSGLSWGIGGEFYATPTLAINAEYTQYLDETGYDLSALGLGLRIGF